MSDFTTKKTKPTAAEYLAASEDQLLERLNRNPIDSEFPFIQSVIAVRTAQSQRETNEKLVSETKSLVLATWVLCIGTMVVGIVTIGIGVWQASQKNGCVQELQATVSYR